MKTLNVFAIVAFGMVFLVTLLGWSDGGLFRIVPWEMATIYAFVFTFPLYLVGLMLRLFLRALVK
jgi:hypothetical protein